MRPVGRLHVGKFARPRRRHTQYEHSLDCATHIFGPFQEKPTARAAAATEVRRTTRLRVAGLLAATSHGGRDHANDNHALLRPAEAYARAKAESAAWSAEAVTSRHLPVCAEVAPRLKGGFAEVCAHVRP